MPAHEALGCRVVVGFCSLAAHRNACVSLALVIRDMSLNSGWVFIQVWHLNIFTKQQTSLQNMAFRYIVLQSCVTTFRQTLCQTLNCAPCPIIHEWWKDGEAGFLALCQQNGCCSRHAVMGRTDLGTGEGCGACTLFLRGSAHGRYFHHKPQCYKHSGCYFSTFLLWLDIAGCTNLVVSHTFTDQL